MAVELQPGDFGEEAWETVELAGAHVLGEVADIAYHATSPGEGWDPFAKYPDTPALIAEVRAHLERLEGAVKKAKADIAGVERVARLAAMRRQRREVEAP
jgi:hypothetical protein